MIRQNEGNSNTLAMSLPPQIRESEKRRKEGRKEGEKQIMN